MSFSFHPAAEEEFIEAVAYYDGSDHQGNWMPPKYDQHVGDQVDPD